MNISDVMDEVGTALETIEGLRVYPYPPDQVAPPAAIVSYPDQVQYDTTYGRGSDRITLPLVVVVGKVSDRASRDRLAMYVDGATGIKAAVEGAEYTALDTIRVTRAEFDVVTINGVDYIAGMFDTDITGQGA